MTGARPTSHAVSAGTIIGRFTFTSNGADGWEVASQVGELRPDVTREATTFIERLHGAPDIWGQVPAVEDRARRFVWAGHPGSPWRYLFNTYSAGMDDSNRPDNNFTDCFVVRRAVPEPASGTGPRPAVSWDSPVWLSPYGPQEVGAADVARLPQPLDLPAGSSDEALLAFASYSVSTRTSAYFTNIATVVRAIADAPTRPARLAASSADLGQRYLDAATSLCPYDVVWETTFEIRNTPGTGYPVGVSVWGTGTDDVEPECPAGVADALWLGEDPRSPQFLPPACRGCGQPRPSWADVVGTLLLALGTLATSEQAAGACMAEADQLLALCTHLAQARVPSWDHAAWFLARDAHPSDTTALVNRLLTLLPAVAADHSRCDGRIAAPGSASPAPAHPVPAQLVPAQGGPAHVGPAQPSPTPSGRSAPRRMALAPRARQEVLQYLSEHRPDERTVLLARVAGTDPGLGHNRILAAHLNFGPATPAARVLDSFADLLAAQDGGTDAVPASLFEWCADSFLSRAVLTLCGFSPPHNRASEPGLLLGADRHLQTDVARATWPEVLVLPLVGRAFLRRWLAPDGASPLARPMGDPAAPRANLGWWLADRAIGATVSQQRTDRVAALELLLDPVRNHPEVAELHACLTHHLESRRAT